MTEKLIRTTAKLYDARDTMRRLHGDNWTQRVNEISPIIRKVAKKGNTSILSAAIQIAEKASKDGQPMASVMVLAVACEISEDGAIDSSAAPPSFGFDRMSKHWPASYRGRIPTKVRMAKDLGPDMWDIMPKGPRIWVKLNDEVPVKCNQHGAMSLLTEYGDLGVKPLECDIIEWREPNGPDQAQPKNQNQHCSTTPNAPPEP